MILWLWLSAGIDDGQESLLLATVDKELAQLALNHQTEVNDLRKT